MAVAELFHRIRRGRTQQEMVAIVTDMAPVEPPGLQEIMDQLDDDLVQQFQHMVDLERD